MERHGLQFLYAVSKRLALVELPEEASVVEARSQHPLVSPADLAVRVPARVRDRDEAIGQGAILGFDREVLLMS